MSDRLANPHFRFISSNNSSDQKNRPLEVLVECALRARFDRDVGAAIHLDWRPRASLAVIVGATVLQSSISAGITRRLSVQMSNV